MELVRQYHQQLEEEFYGDAQADAERQYEQYQESLKQFTVMQFNMLADVNATPRRSRMWTPPT